jgi:predicted RNase H-like HicB family nuclease
MPKRLNAVITRDDEFFVAHCIELAVVSQGKTIEEAQANLREAVELYIESFGADDLPESQGELVIYPIEVAVRG